MEIKIHSASKLVGEISVPSDKSISHRAVMLASIASGVSTIVNPLLADDVLRTIHAFRQMGIEISKAKNGVIKIYGKGMYGLKEPSEVIDVGNSGTTIRLLMGILAAQPFQTVLFGDNSLAKRPMARVADPLRLMGARIIGQSGGNYIPIAIRGNSLKSITYQIPIPSAQVKSAILLAGLYAGGTTTVTELMQTRDHTERMLRSFGVSTEINENQIRISQQNKLEANEVKIPGDISSAAFLIAAALLIPNSDLRIYNVGLNPTRSGFLTALSMMGARIEILEEKVWGDEVVVDLHIRHQPLKGTVIEGKLIPLLIDEIPILALLATQAEGVTEIRNAEELRVKESDRIKAISLELGKMNADIQELEDGLRIVGKTELVGTTVSSHYDHRIAMTLVIAGLIAKGTTTIGKSDVINVSYPNFLDDIKKLID